MGRSSNRKPDKKSSWVPLALILFLAQPQLMIPLAVFGGIIWLCVQAVKKQQGASSGSASRKSATRYTTRQEKFDECPQGLFCRHKDKAVHHVRRGQELDPWDRPDIDISKYQRRN